MQIIFDYDHPPGSPMEVTHSIHTGSGEQPQVLIAAISATPIDVIQFIKALHLGTFPIAGTGWDQVTKHPAYPGQTRLQALIGEIIRLNDTAARTILGV